MAVAFEITFPVGSILDKCNQQIQNYVELVGLGRALITNHKEVFPFAVFTDVTSTVRTNEENVDRLLQVVKARGLQGFVKFVSTLLNDRISNHVILGRSLLAEVQKVFEEQNGEFPQEERALLIPLLNILDPVKPPPPSLGGDEEVPRHARVVRRVLAEHGERLRQEIQLASLRLLLVKHGVLTQEEYEDLTELPPEQRNEELIRRVARKSDLAVVAFHRCLNESPKHAKLAELFDQAMKNPEEEEEEGSEQDENTGHVEPPPSTKTDKMAVFLCMEEYIRLAEDSRAVGFSLHSVNHRYKQNRERLKSCLRECGFEVVDLGNLFVREEAASEEPRPRKEVLYDLYQKYVVNRCEDNGTVFIYVTGLLYPAEIEQDKISKQSPLEKAYSGAILLHGAPDICRRHEESICAHDLNQWVELLPTPFITMLIDCHASHIALYARQQKPKESYILEFPWLELTRWNSRTVVYGLSPDKQAVLYVPPEAVKPEHPFGLLTEKFVKVFESWIHRGKPATTTHILFYEQISYYWNGRQRAHLLFSPSIQGDVDRTFLGGDGYPYRQWLRADLMSNKSPSSPRERFDLARVQLRTSKMAGLIIGDVLDAFHICRPEEVFKGRVVEAHQMCAIVAMENVEALAQLLEEEYRDIPPGRDSSMDFLCLRKSSLLHVKKDYTVFLDLGEDDCSKLKHHINTSPLLTVVDSSEDVKIVVKKEGQAYTIEDLSGDVTYRPKVKDIVHVPSLLEMMAWFKFVKAIPAGPFSPRHSCYLTYNTDQPLLNSGIAIEASPHNASHPVSAAILNFGVKPLFWEPGECNGDAWMRINLASNHVITALEIRGDATNDFYARELKILYQKMFSKDFVYRKDILQLPANVTAQKVTLQMCETVIARDEPCLRFLSKEGTVLTCNGRKEVTWEWKSANNLESQFVFDEPSNVDRLELTDMAVNQTIKVTLHSDLTTYSPTPNANLKFSSAWPRRYKFDTPIVASLIELHPINPPSSSSDKPPKVSMQVQLYGVKYAATLEVEEKERLTVHFENKEDFPVFVYMLCLEETGMVQFVFSEFVRGKSKDKSEGGSTMKKFISTSFPKEHNVPAITDTYKVFVSRKMMYLEPYIQRRPS
eukprot:Em0022g371a